MEEVRGTQESQRIDNYKKPERGVIGVKPEFPVRSFPPGNWKTGLLSSGVG